MIEFPNHSRSYEPVRRAVRFWGHDSVIEASFFINEDALKRIAPDVHADEFGVSQSVRFQPRADICRGSQGLCSRRTKFI